MATTTLSGTRADITRHVGRLLSLSGTVADWASENTTDVTAIIKSGEREFYGAYPWSFLRPECCIDIESDEWEYDLPSDFGGFLDTWLSFTSEDNSVCPVRQTGVAEIMRMRMTEQLVGTGNPEWFAVRWSTSNGESDQRAMMIVYPTPSETATLQGTYYSVPYGITDASPYPLGGQPHFETLLECCLAAAELFMNDTVGVHRQRYESLLAQSIAHDKRTGVKNLGYNGDRGANRVMRPPIRSDYVTYNGASII